MIVPKAPAGVSGESRVRRLLTPERAANGVPLYYWS